MTSFLIFAFGLLNAVIGLAIHAELRMLIGLVLIEKAGEYMPEEAKTTVRLKPDQIREAIEADRNNSR